MIRLKLLVFTLCLLALCVVGLIGLFTVIAENEHPFLTRPRPRQFYDLYPLNLQLLNLPHFNYIINNDVCGLDTIEAVLLVTSHCGNVEARSAIRQAYPQNELKNLGIRRLFLLAVSSSVNENSIHDENKRYSDVLQGSFLEAYRNLTYKHVMGLQWAVHHCPQARFVVKMDDDIVVNMYKLSEIISHISESQRKDLLMGYVLRGMVPVREPVNKWYVTHAEFSGNMYPQFLSGWMYVTTPPVINKLLSAAQKEKFFWIDDTFVTGILAQRAGVEGYSNISNTFTTDPGYLECCLRHTDVHCDYMVGPSGGDYSLHIRLARHAKRCRDKGSCKNRSPQNALKRTCVNKGRQQLPLSGGQGYVAEIKIG